MAGELGLEKGSGLLSPAARNVINSSDRLGMFLVPETKVIPVLKAMQFFLMCYFVSSSMLGPHGVFYAMMSNPLYAVNIMFTMTGLLTHMRYRSLFCSAETNLPFRSRINLYYVLRFGYLLPGYLVAFAISCVASFPMGFWSFFVNLFGMSSLFCFLPWKPLPEFAIMSGNAMWLLVSSITIVWAAYPLLVQPINIVSKSWILTSWLKGALLVVALFNMVIVFPLAGAASLANFSGVPEVNLALSNQLKYSGHGLGTASWFLNPIFVSIYFFTGMLLAELAYHLKWLHKQSANGVKGVTKFIIHKVLFPVTVDYLVVTIFMVMFSSGKLKHPQLIRMMNFFCRPFRGFPHFIDPVHVGWKASSPLLLYPLECIVILLCCAPCNRISLFQMLLSDGTVLGVVPGRVSCLILMWLMPVVQLGPAWLAENLKIGRGLFILMFVAYFPSILFYYYVMQPIQVLTHVKCASWLSKNCPQYEMGVLDEESHGDHVLLHTPKKEDIEEPDMYEGPLPLSIESPNYDPYDLKNPKNDMKRWMYVNRLVFPTLKEVDTVPQFGRLVVVYIRELFFGYHMNF